METEMTDGSKLRLLIGAALFAWSYVAGIGCIIHRAFP